MTTLLEEIIGSRDSDVPRYLKIIEKNIESGELKRYTTYEKTKNKIASEEENEEKKNGKSQSKLEKLSDDVK